jgi:CheY-like chemotaxis protein
VHVSDNGEGMDASELGAVFSLFAQGHQAVDRPRGGLGLGLTIAQSLARLHGGDLAASSAGRGQGSRFSLRLPLLDPGRQGGAGSAGGAREARSARADALRVLVVDDNVDAALMLAELLNAFGHRAAVAHDGPSALQRLREEGADVALLDIGLPAMDGYELAEQIRSEPRWREMRLVALTGYGQAGDREQSLRAGFAAHLVKPVETDVLLDALRAGASDRHAG